MILYILLAAQVGDFSWLLPLQDGLPSDLNRQWSLCLSAAQGGDFPWLLPFQDSALPIGRADAAAYLPLQHLQADVASVNVSFFAAQGGGFSWLLPFQDGAPPIGWADAAAYLSLPVLLVASQYLSQKIISPPQSNDPSQQSSQWILKFLPLMIGEGFARVFLGQHQTACWISTVSCSAIACP